MQMQTEAAVQTASVAVSGVSAAGAVITTLRDVAMDVMGVPLPVVLAAIAGAFGARSYLAPVGFVRGVSGSMLWALIACGCAPLAQTIIAAMSGWQLPTTALSGVAVLIAAGGQIAAPVVAEELPHLVRRCFAKFGGGQ